MANSKPSSVHLPVIPFGSALGCDEAAAKAQSREPRIETFRFGDAPPNAAAVRELTWFFNEAESAIEGPSYGCALVAGCTATTLDEEEARIEAVHAAGKINGWLAKVHTTEALLLAGLFTQRPCPKHVRRALGVLAGAVEVLPSVRAEHLGAVATARTHADNVAGWLEELVAGRDRDRVVAWKREAARSCAIAIAAYERARGTGPCAVPDNEEEGR